MYSTLEGLSMFSVHGSMGLSRAIHGSRLELTMLPLPAVFAFLYIAIGIFYMLRKASRHHT